MNKILKPHEICKKAGLKSLAQLSEISGVSIQTLNNWAKFKPKLFKCLICGAVSRLDKQDTITELSN